MIVGPNIKEASRSSMSNNGSRFELLAEDGLDEENLVTVQTRQPSKGKGSQKENTKDMARKSLKETHEEGHRDLYPQTQLNSILLVKEPWMLMMLQAEMPIAKIEESGDSLTSRNMDGMTSPEGRKEKKEEEGKRRDKEGEGEQASTLLSEKKKIRSAVGEKKNMEELPISPTDSRGSPGKEQQAAGVGILLQIMMLVLSFVLGHVLRRHRFYYLPEASASLLIGNTLIGLSFRLSKILTSIFALYNPSAGLIVGGLANISNTENSIRAWFNFHEEFFFLFLLPPIILYPFLYSCLNKLLLSGFSLQPKPFFSNFGAIVAFAILGTFIASVVTGILVYLGGAMYLMYKLPFVECLMFGALISATDPVTVLSIFQVSIF
ncbi:hypothetical protein M9H77_11680 [Catharanthus roseus]|uniref:Uncharacterized protein n=1 Tax=Catharanthus roseus TaxID=4058 RepID=A0ACC0BFA5_CATRO|nr:hypothetical protein M9H77_11680 [Catharanthus roseus]